MLKTLLPTLDSLSSALSASTASTSALREGISLTHSQLLATLAEQNITVIPAAPNDPFDPHRHEAMTMQPGGVAQTIAAVFRDGYKHEETTVRATQVAVFDGKEAN